QIEAKIQSTNLAAEEIEDLREQLFFQIESQSLIVDDQLGEVLELAEAVLHYDRLVILGDPGSGKTTLLRYLGLKHAQALQDARTIVDSDLGKAKFPILIRIADYAEH